MRTFLSHLERTENAHRSRRGPRDPDPTSFSNAAHHLTPLCTLPTCTRPCTLPSASPMRFPQSLSQLTPFRPPAQTSLHGYSLLKTTRHHPCPSSHFPAERFLGLAQGGSRVPPCKRVHSGRVTLCQPRCCPQTPARLLMRQACTECSLDTRVRGRARVSGSAVRAQAHSHVSAEAPASGPRLQSQRRVKKGAWGFQVN